MMQENQGPDDKTLCQQAVETLRQKQALQIELEALRQDCKETASQLKENKRNLEEILTNLKKQSEDAPSLFSHKIK